MWKILRGGATVIPGATFIPESRVWRQTRNSNLKRTLVVLSSFTIYELDVCISIDKGPYFSAKYGNRIIMSNWRSAFNQMKQKHQEV